MSSFFNWDLSSFINCDKVWLQRELIIIPILVLVLWFFWMKSVKSALVDEVKAMEDLNAGQSDDEGAIASQVSNSEDSDSDDDGKKPQKSDLNNKKDK